jgi:hypothetical protein
MYLLDNLNHWSKRPKSAENSVRFRDSQILKYLLYCAEIYHYSHLHINQSDFVAPDIKLYAEN